MTVKVGYWREYFLGKLKIYSGELLKGKIMANYNVYFSPTGTTERVVKHMGESFGSMENIDLSRRDMKNHEMEQGDFCIVGSSVLRRTCSGNCDRETSENKG